jgi:hypothetical protein
MDQKLILKKLKALNMSKDFFTVIVPKKMAQKKTKRDDKKQKRGLYTEVKRI